jgi:hypothetical protein
MESLNNKQKKLLFPVPHPRRFIGFPLNSQQVSVEHESPTGSAASLSCPGGFFLRRAKRSSKKAAWSRA